MSKIKLQDRVHLSFILPQEDSFERLILREEITDKVKITAKEVEEYDIKTLENGAISWKIEDKDNAFDYEFSESEKNYLSSILVELSEEKKLNANMMDMYKTFVQNS